MLWSALVMIMSKRLLQTLAGWLPCSERKTHVNADEGLENMRRAYIFCYFDKVKGYWQSHM